MTLLADPHAPAGPRWQRVWGIPVWAHLAALGVILLLLVPIVGPSQSFIADEGAAMIQARSLERGDGWIVEHPLPEVDPDGRWYPVVNAERGEKGFAPLGKHPLYPVLAAAGARLGGTAGMVALSLAGTVAAAGLASLLAGRADPALARPAVWTVGLGSPLLFDGFLVMGHTLSAALATAAVLAAVVAIQERRPAVALLVAPAIGGAVLLRNEALLFAIALTLVAGALTLRRTVRLPAGVVAAAAVGGAVAARIVDRVWLSRVVGTTVRASELGVPAAGDGFVQGRIEGITTTWLTPGYGRFGAGLLALLVMLAALGWCVLRARTRPADRNSILASAAIAAGAAVAALVLEPANVVPGLLFAFPVAAAGMLAARRSLFDDTGLIIAGATAGLFALAVIATQYAVGGSGEWGGRYFALAVPTAVPLFLAAIRRRGWSLPIDVRRTVGAALVVCTAALSVMAVNALRVNHRSKADLVARIETAGQATGDPRPVVLATWVGASRLAWPTFEGHRWLFVPEEEVGTAVARLRGANVDRFVVITTDLPSIRPQLVGLRVVVADGATDGEGRQILVLEGGA